MKIELILLGIIAIVLVVDFIIRGLKKKDKIEKGIEPFEEGLNESKKQNKFNYILSRKRNLVSFIIMVHLLKLAIHYFMYRTINPAAIGRSKQGNMWCKQEGIRVKLSDCIKLEVFDFNWHIENIYSSEVLLFVPSFIILAVIIWLLNDKIKAR
jgi:hypothetical protein